MADDQRRHYLRDQAENDAVVKSLSRADNTERLAALQKRVDDLYAGFPRDDVVWLLARCRLLEAERDKAKQQGREEAAEAIELRRDSAHLSTNTANIFDWAAKIARESARGGSVPETPPLQAENEER